jgi:ATPase family associated with various cellular activities (AAA)
VSDDRFSPEEFGAAYQRFMEWVSRAEESERSPFKAVLTEHFGADPATFPVTAESLARYDLPNFQLAMDAYLERPDVDHRLVGFAGHLGYAEMSLSGLVHDVGFGIAEGPVRRTVVPLEKGRSVTCVTTGLFLISVGDRRLAALVMQGERGFDDTGLRLEVIAPDAEDGERLLAELRRLMLDLNVYRGKVLALKEGGGLSVEFPSVERVDRDDIVLPDGVLDVVELHTIEFARYSDVLRAGGRHVRRGLLLHGPPGTGKTLTAGYLIAQLEGRTVVILTGAALGFVAEACAIARDLQPAMVVLEDVDLVARRRTMMGATSLLFQLLNEMDGIGEDADVIFLMTTNRADLLEPALASRPGRVDQAVELPLPDAEARWRLIELFSSGLEIALEDREPITAATEGVSPAFLRELVRKAALQAARSGTTRLTDAHFSDALKLLELGGSVTRAMLGADGGAAARRLDDEDEDWGFDDYGGGGSGWGA